MLKEIYCKEFKENGKTRDKIFFHKGLNTIIGESSINGKSENSVGKSTLLMIIDFVFGGEQFLKSKAVETIGNHTICFEFEFNATPHYFMRSTEKKDCLFKCNSHYQEKVPYSIEDFREWLKVQYNLEEIELSFREIVSTYFRFYGSKDISPKEVLRLHNAQPLKEQIRVFEKLYEKYGVIKDIVESIENVENYKAVKKQAAKLKVDIDEFKKVNIKEESEKIAELEEKKKEILKSQKIESIALDAKKAEEIANLKAEHKRLAFSRTRLLTRIANIERNDTFATIKSSQAAYDELLTFFPNVNIKKISEIDTFHDKLNSFLKAEAEESVKSCKNDLKAIQSRIEEIESILFSEENREFSSAFLTEFAKLQSQIDAIQKTIDDAKRQKDTEKKVKDNKKALLATEANLLSQIASSINKSLEEKSKAILGENAQSITLSFPSVTSYKIGSDKDDGTGTDYTSMILFDLAVLEQTKLPALIHDSYLVSNIRGNRLENLIKLYAQEKDKQIFLSIDETEKLNSDTAKLIEQNSVIHLHQNGGELYGNYWGRK